MKQRYRIVLGTVIFSLVGLLVSGCFAPKWLWPFGGASSWQIRVVNCPETFRNEVTDLEVTLLSRGRAPVTRRLPLTYNENGNVYTLTVQKEILLDTFGRTNLNQDDSLIVNYERYIDPWVILLEDSSGTLIGRDSVKLQSDQVRMIDCDAVRRQFDLNPEVEFSFARSYTIFRTSSEERLSVRPGKDDNNIRVMGLVFDSTRGITQCVLENPCDFGRPDTTR